MKIAAQSLMVLCSDEWQESHFFVLISLKRKKNLFVSAILKKKIKNHIAS